MADETIFFDSAKAIIDRMTAEYGGTLPVVWDNDDGQDLDLSSGFIQLSIRWISSQFASINGANPLVRGQNQVLFEIYTPSGEGIGDGLNEAGAIGKIFRGQQFSSMLFFDVSIESTRSVKRPEGQFYETPLICPFQLDNHVSIV